MKVYQAINDFPTYGIARDGEVVSGPTQKPLKPRTVNGYHCVTLGGRRGKQIAVHVLVAEAFICPRPAGLVVNHRNADRKDNKVENLEWVTQSENVRHAYSLGRRVIDQAQRDRCAALGRAKRKHTTGVTA